MTCRTSGTPPPPAPRGGSARRGGKAGRPGSATFAKSLRRRVVKSRRSRGGEGNPLIPEPCPRHGPNVFAVEKQGRCPGFAAAMDADADSDGPGVRYGPVTPASGRTPASRPRHPGPTAPAPTPGCRRGGQPAGRVGPGRGEPGRTAVAAMRSAAVSRPWSHRRRPTPPPARRSTGDDAGQPACRGSSTAPRSVEADADRHGQLGRPGAGGRVVAAGVSVLAGRAVVGNVGLDVERTAGIALSEPRDHPLAVVRGA